MTLARLSDGAFHRPLTEAAHKGVQELSLDFEGRDLRLEQSPSECGPFLPETPSQRRAAEWLAALAESRGQTGVPCVWLSWPVVPTGDGSLFDLVWGRQRPGLPRPQGTP